MKLSSKLLPVILPLMLALGNGCATQATNPAPAASGPEAATPVVADGITDAEIRDVVNRVARHQMQPLQDGEYPNARSMDEARSAKSPEGIMWNYPWGVALYGMECSTDVTRDRVVDNFVVQHNLICARYYSWLAGLEKQFGYEADKFASSTKIKEFIALGKLDNCGAMGNAVIESMLCHPGRVTQDERVLAARAADWVANRQDRLPDGTLWREKAMGGTVWPDDLYMGGVFLVRYGIYTGEQKFIDDAAEQIIHQASLEQDADGLWFHGYFVNEKRHAPYKWSRGNGWAMVTIVETLSALPQNSPLRPALLDILRKQVEGLKKVQAPDGMWRQVLDHPELWEETSGTAMFTYSIARAVNRGWIDPSNMAVARRAFVGISHNVRADGGVAGTCEGTGIGPSLDFYIKRKQPFDDLHGRGPVLLAGTEILRAGSK